MEFCSHDNNIAGSSFDIDEYSQIDTERTPFQETTPIENGESLSGSKFQTQK